MQRLNRGYYTTEDMKVTKDYFLSIENLIKENTAPGWGYEFIYDKKLFHSSFSAYFYRASKTEKFRSHHETKLGNLLMEKLKPFFDDDVITINVSFDQTKRQIFSVDIIYEDGIDCEFHLKGDADDN